MIVGIYRNFHHRDTPEWIAKDFDDYHKGRDMPSRRWYTIARYWFLWINYAHWKPHHIDHTVAFIMQKGLYPGYKKSHVKQAVQRMLKRLEIAYEDGR